MAKAKQRAPMRVPMVVGKALKRLHYLLEVILLCVRWCVASLLSLRNFEEMMPERGIKVDHSSAHRCLKRCFASTRAR